jgi:hypothetical protein
MPMSEPKPSEMAASVGQEPTSMTDRQDHRSEQEIQRLEDELVATRRALAQAEQQLLELRDWRSTEIGRLERQVYWLERWGIDLDKVMARRSAMLAFRAVRGAVRLRRWVFRSRRT